MSTESTSLTGINSATKTSAAINYKSNKNKHNHNNKNNNNNNNNNNSPSTVAMNSSITAATPAAVIKIKKELPNEEIKEFAENTMNELLGWYGFDGVDRLDLSAKTTRLLQANSTSTSTTSTTIATITTVTTTESLSSCSGQSNRNYNQKNCINNNGNKVICFNTTPQQYEKRRSRSLRRASTLQQQQENEYMRSFNKELQQYRNPHNNNNNNNKNNNNTNQKNNINNNKSLLNCHNYHQRPVEGNDSTTSDHDTHSSRDDDSISPNSMGTNNNKTPTIITMRNSANSMEEKIDLQNCCWCHRPVPDNAPEYLTTTDCPRYCSESCFTQSRRASFKKAKTCDWCKHIRHAVSYVDFQDGASQLQFCSDKCLNQYKMQIFCKETQAHLDMNPHLREQGLEAANSGVGLITPDLWLKNCRSRSASPTSTVSLPPSPKAVAGQSKLSSPTRSIGSNVTPSSCGIPGTVKASIYKPLISVAPVAKLMSNKSPTLIAAASTVRQGTPSKHNRKKRPITTTCAATMSDVNSMKTNCSPCASSNSPINANVLLTKSHLRTSSRDNNRLLATQSHTTPSLTQFAGSSVQDLHMNVPPLSPMIEPSVNSGATTHVMPSFGPGMHGANYFNSSPVSVLTGTPGFPSRPPPPPPFLPNPAGLLPRFLPNFPTLPPAPIPPPLLMTPEMSAFNALIGTPHPVTVMVPYPVVIPLPVPIPIPLPVLDFYKAHLTPEERQKFNHQRSTVHEEYKLQSSNQTNEKRIEKEERRSSNIVEQPLDCSKTREVDHLKEEYDSTIDPAIDQTVEYSPNKSENIEKFFNSEMDKNLHCVPEKDEVSDKEINKDNNNLEESLGVEASGSGRGEETEDGEVIQKLPKLKITRLQNKRPQIQTKESECSRPLRKRKRIIDCDFQKIHLKESYGENEDHQEDLTQQLAAEAASDTNKAGNSK